MDTKRLEEIEKLFESYEHPYITSQSHEDMRWLIKQVKDLTRKSELLQKVAHKAQLHYTNPHPEDNDVSVPWDDFKELLTAIHDARESGALDPVRGNSE